MLGRIAGAACFSLLIATAPVHAEDKKPADPRLTQLAEQLRMAVTRCWLPPVAPKNQPLEVTVKFQLAKDGSIVGTPEILKPQKGEFFKSLAESAVRAVKRCSPLNTVAENPDLYDDLKEIIMHFHSPAH